MAEYNEVKDSGERREFSTGSVRDRSAGKGRYDLITPIGLRRLAVHYENGAVKYGDRNWEKGQPISCYLDSAIRHLFAYLEGKRDEDHLAAAAWNAFGAIHTVEKVAAGELPVELDDVPPLTGAAQALSAISDAIEAADDVIAVEERCRGEFTETPLRADRQSVTIFTQGGPECSCAGCTAARARILGAGLEEPCSSCMHTKSCVKLHCTGASDADPDA